MGRNKSNQTEGFINVYHPFSNLKVAILMESLSDFQTNPDPMVLLVLQSIYHLNPYGIFRLFRHFGRMSHDVPITVGFIAVIPASN